MKKLIYASIIILFPTVLVAAPCSPNQVKATLNAWGKTLSRLNPKASASLQYTPNATLMGTYAKTSASSLKERENYFKRFINDNKAIRVKFDETKIITKKGSSIASGIYTFTITDVNNKVKKVTARYTYVLEERAKDCKIISHHSSVIPKGAK